MSEEKLDRKKQQAIVQGRVREKGTGRKFVDLFTSADASSVGSYILSDVVIPAAKNLISDIVTEGVERFLFGEGRRRTTYHRSGGGTYTNYSRISQSSGARDRNYREMSHTARRKHDFSEIVFSTRNEAEAVLDKLISLIDSYDTATVSDFYDLSGVSTNFADARWGWVSLAGSSVQRVREGYIINVPPAIEL